VDDIQNIHRFGGLTNMNSFGDVSLDPSSIDNWAADIRDSLVEAASALRFKGPGSCSYCGSSLILGFSLAPLEK